MSAIQQNVIEAETVEETALAVRPAVDMVPKPEIVPTPVVRDFIDNPFIGAGTIDLAPEQIAVLEKYTKVPHDWIQIKPNDGLIYMGHMYYRRVANEAFGPGRWALVPNGDFTTEKNGNTVTLYRSYRMYVNGKFLREAVGSGSYFANNAKMNYADAAESCESDVLKRLFKPFGIAGQCWDPRYQEWFKKQYCSKVGSDWKRVKWDEVGWWDGKTTTVEPKPEKPQMKAEFHADLKAEQTGDPTEIVGVPSNAGIAHKGEEEWYWVKVFDNQYWTDSKQAYYSILDRIEQSKPIAFSFEKKGNGFLITRFNDVNKEE